MRVVLIHHGDEQRLQAVNRTVETVAEVLGEVGSVEVGRVGYQPAIRSLAAHTVVARYARQWLLERRWSAHLGVSRRWVLSSGLLCLRLLQQLAPSHRTRGGRQSHIELALSAKHQHAWRSAVEDEVDLLVVLEDDARVQEGSTARLRDALRVVSSLPDMATAYLDLAGGLSVKALRLEGVSTPWAGEVHVLSKAATNTTCAYLVGSQLLKLLVDAVITDPGIARLPADWLMNRVFMEAGDDAVTCLHTRPPALDHGSFSGTVRSAIRP